MNALLDILNQPITLSVYWIFAVFVIVLAVILLATTYKNKYQLTMTDYLAAVKRLTELNTEVVGCKNDLEDVDKIVLENQQTIKYLEQNSELLKRQAIDANQKYEQLRLKLDLSADYKNKVYTTLLNSFTKVKSLFWQGNLEVRMQDDTQRLISNLIALKEEYAITESLLDSFLKPEQMLTELEQSVLDKKTYQEVTVVIPINKYNDLLNHVWRLKSEYESTIPALPLEE